MFHPANDPDTDGAQRVSSDADAARAVPLTNRCRKPAPMCPACVPFVSHQSTALPTDRRVPRHHAGRRERPRIVRPVQQFTGDQAAAFTNFRLAEATFRLEPSEWTRPSVVEAAAGLLSVDI